MNAVMRHLLWKDVRLIQSLLVAMLFATLMFNFVAWFLLWSNGTHRNNIDLAVMIWIVMPNMLALGVPAMLVGHEEENGTLGWIRSLPISWTSVVLSKLIIGLVAIAMSWVLSSALLAGLLPQWDAPLPVFSNEALQAASIARCAFFGLQLLLVGFLLSYLFRSPIVSLLVLAPLMVCLTAALNYAGYFGDGRGELSASVFVLWSIFGVAYLVVLTLFLFFAARWRLKRRRQSTSTRESQSQSPRVPMSVPYASSRSFFIPSRPSVRRALLWQAWQQQQRPLIALSILAAVCVWVIYLWGDQTWHQGVEPAAVAIASSNLILISTWLGSLCFYGDSVSRRHFYFADRGISANQFWWTRMAAPAAAMLILFLLAWMVMPYEHFNRQRLIPLSYLVVAFACGQLAAMWMTRSTLTFFWGPTLLIGLVIFVYPIVNLFQNYYGWFSLAAIPLVFATWRMSSEFLNGRRGTRFQSRIASYVYVAWLLVISTVLAKRYVLIPAELPQWRAQMLAEPLPSAFAKVDPLVAANVDDYLAPWLATQDIETLKLDPRVRELVGESDVFSPASATNYWREVRRDLTSWPADKNISKTQPRSAKLLLQWAKAARLAVLDGQVHPASVLMYAAQDEWTAIGALSRLVQSDGARTSDADAKRIKEALDELASPELIEKSWRTAMIMEWRLYQSRSYPESYIGQKVEIKHTLFGLEELRARRYVDAATQMSLNWPEIYANTWFGRSSLNKVWTQVYGNNPGLEVLPNDYGIHYHLKRIRDSL